MLCRECVASCPQSTYEVSGVCESCPLPCDECVADVDDQSVVCLSCIVGRYLVSTNNVTSCTGLCPERHYAGKTTAALSATVSETILRTMLNFVLAVLLNCCMHPEMTRYFLFVLQGEIFKNAKIEELWCPIAPKPYVYVMQKTDRVGKLWGNGLSWLPVSFLLHVKYTLSYCIVS